MAKIIFLIISTCLITMSCEDKNLTELKEPAEIRDLLKSSDYCLLDPDPGFCRAYMPRYYFDKNTRSCKEFIWGGCGGIVPFKTLKECESACQ